MPKGGEIKYTPIKPLEISTMGHEESEDSTNLAILEPI